MEASRFRPESLTEDEQVFKQFGLDNPKDVFPNPHGNIPSRLIEGTREMIWGLRKGSHYPPEMHAHGHTLTIQHGSGIISINGGEKHYGPGNTFDIAGNVPHGFIRVDETTVVKQK